MGTSPYSNDPRRDLMIRRNDSLAPQQDMYVPRPDYYGNAPAQEQNTSLNFLIQCWQTVRRSKITLLLFALAGIILAVLITMQLTPIYQAKTTIELQGVNENFLGMKAADPTVELPDYSSDGIVQTQIKILQSNSLMKRVVPKLTPADGKAPVEQGTRMAAWRTLLHLPGPKPEMAREEAVNYAAGHLVVKAAENTRIVEISTDSPDRHVATDFVNTLANEYIEQNLESRWNTSQHTGEWLTKQLEGLKQKLERSEDQLQAYAQQTGLMFTGEKESVSEDRLRQLQQELLRSETERVAKQSKYEQSVTATPEALPEVLDDSTLKDYQSRLSDLRRQLADLSSTLTPAHYKVQKVQAQITELQKAADRERANVIKRIHNEYDSAKRREDLIRGEYTGQTRLVTGQSAKAIHYGILKREVDTNRQLYDSMLQKVKEAGITAAMRASNVRVVDPAEAPMLPYKPNPFRNAVLGFLGGLFGGLGFVILRDRIDRSIQSPGDAQTYLNVPEFGVIPSAEADTGRRLYGTPRGGSKLLEADKPKNGYSNGNGSNGHAHGREALELAMLKQTPSLMAESFRSTLTSILFSNHGGAEAPRVIVLTSPSPSEGKTTVLCNLGLAMAETQRRVLLIDADLRRPRLHDIFDIPNNFGLRDVLEGKEMVEKTAPLAIISTETPGLFVMPSGSPTASISTLLHSAQLPHLLSYLQEQFDAVFIDTPPMLHMPDARILARIADGVILVIRSGKTTRDTAQLATQRFLEDGTPVLGTILNDWNPKHKTTYGYQNYESGYHEYHGKES